MANEHGPSGSTDYSHGYDVGTPALDTGAETTGATSSKQTTEDTREADNRNFLVYCITITALLLFLSGLSYALLTFGLFVRDQGVGDTTSETELYVVIRTSASTTTTTRPTTPTPPKPTDANYKRSELQGLICHSTYDNILNNNVTPSCDFVIVDIETLEPFAQPGEARATVPLVPSDLSRLLGHLWAAPVFPLIFSHNGSLLRQQNRATLPQILRGLRQNIVDNNAHGVALGWPLLQEADLAALLPQARMLSDEMDEYHGMFRYDRYTGSPQALSNFVISVGKLASMTMIYRVSGRTSIFTNPYYTNFYLNRLNEKPLETLIEEEVVQPIIAAGGNVKVAISMSLLARSCATNTVYGNPGQTQCTTMPLDTAQICKLWPAYIQGHYYSFVTRRYRGGNNSDLTEDIFFETQYTVSRKAYHMLMQLRRANVSPRAFVIERHDLDLAQTVNYVDHRSQNVACAAGRLGIIETTRSEIAKVI